MDLSAPIFFFFFILLSKSKVGFFFTKVDANILSTATQKGDGHASASHLLIIFSLSSPTQNRPPAKTYLLSALLLLSITAKAITDTTTRAVYNITGAVSPVGALPALCAGF